MNSKVSFLSSKALCALSVCALFLSCGEDRTYEYEEKTQTSHWMLEAMQDNYLWADSIHANQLTWKDYFAAPSSFLSKLTAMAPVTDSWSWCSVDTVNSNPYVRGRFDSSNSYGLDFTIMTDPTSGTTRQYARVVTVYPNSPAERCGLVRGDFIGAVDGTRFTSSLSSSLVSGRSHRLAVSKLGVNTEEATYLWTSTDTLTIEKSEAVEDCPFPVASSWTYGTHRVSYLMVNHLDESASTGQSSYTDKLQRMMESFRSAQPDVFILDLRLCNYGSIHQALLLASYVCPSLPSGSVFANTIYRTDHQSQNQTFTFNSSVNLTSIKYLYIITSSYTRGAGEWLIRGIQNVSPEGTVFTYGQTTNGQIVMTGSVASDYYVTLHPAIAFVADGAGSYDYTSGIAPDVSIDEMNYVDLYTYGDEREVILSNILQNLP